MAIQMSLLGRVSCCKFKWNLRLSQIGLLQSYFLKLSHELADADTDAFLPWREQLALCPTEQVERRLPEESDLARVSPIQRMVRCLARALHLEPCEQPGSVGQPTPVSDGSDLAARLLRS